MHEYDTFSLNPSAVQGRGHVDGLTPDGLKARLNELGKQGWRLVVVSPVTYRADGRTHQETVAVMEREVVK